MLESYSQKKQGWEATEILGGGWGPANGLGDLDSRNSRRQMGTGGWTSTPQVYLHLHFLYSLSLPFHLLSTFLGVQDKFNLCRRVRYSIATA
jgi:hypothetical protein